MRSNAISTYSTTRKTVSASVTVVGTPFCITVDHRTLEDKTVTVRHRDSMEQQRVAIADLSGMIAEETGFRKLFAKLC